MKTFGLLAFYRKTNEDILYSPPVYCFFYKKMGKMVYLIKGISSENLFKIFDSKTFSWSQVLGSKNRIKDGAEYEYVFKTKNYSNTNIDKMVVKAIDECILSGLHLNILISDNYYDLRKVILKIKEKVVAICPVCGKKTSSTRNIIKCKYCLANFVW